MSAANPDERNLKKILNMTLKLTDQETKEFEATEMSDERKEFLQQAIAQTLEEDEVKKLAYFTDLFLAFDIDVTYTEPQLELMTKLFEDILYLVEGMDIALEFNKMYGLTHCIKLLKSKYSSIQWRAADLLACCLLNNLKCQSSVLENKGMITLLHILKTSDVDIVKVKCVYALSALCGNYEEAEKLFIQLRGIDVLINIIHEHRDGDKLQVKSIFLLQKFLFTEFENGIDFVTIATNLVPILTSDHNNMHEIILNIIHEVIQRETKNINQVFPNKEQILEFMDGRKNELLNKNQDEKYLDEIFKYNELIKLLQ